VERLGHHPDTFQSDCNDRDNNLRGVRSTRENDREIRSPDVRHTTRGEDFLKRNGQEYRERERDDGKFFYVYLHFIIMTLIIIEVVITA
jgi:hypothetical protein